MPVRNKMPEVEIVDTEAPKGQPPDPHVRFGHFLARALLDGTARITVEPRPRDETPKVRDYHRPSDAGKCVRQVGYVSIGAPKTNPMDIASGMSTGVGTLLGELLANALIDNQEELGETLGSPVVEITAEFSPGGRDETGAALVYEVQTETGPLRCKGFVDVLVVLEDGRRIVLEVKATADYSFKAKTGIRTGNLAEGVLEAYGPQLAEYADVVGATEAVVVLLPMNPISAAEARRRGLPPERRVAAEWTFTREELLPIARAEYRRAKRILQLVADGEMPPRRIPSRPGGEIVQPATGAWRALSGGKVENVWNCGYCGWQDRCAEDLVAEELAAGAPVADGGAS